MRRALGNDPLKQSLFRKTTERPARAPDRTEKPPAVDASPSAESSPSPAIELQPVTAGPTAAPQPAPPVAPPLILPLPPPDESPFPDQLQLICFQLDDHEFGLEISDVQRVVRVVETTRMPQAPRYVEGIIDVMGVIVPVVSLRRLFGRPPQPISLQGHIIIGEHDGQPVGFLVDSVSEVLDIPSSAVSRPGPVTPLKDFLIGVAKLQSRLLLLTRVDRFVGLLRGMEELTAAEVFESGHPFGEPLEGDEPTASVKEALHRRAVALSHKMKDEETEVRQLLTFFLAEEWYGVDTLRVKTIVGTPRIFSVPCAPDYISGVINLRGEILTVIDLKSFFDLHQTRESYKKRVVVVEFEEHLLGLLVDLIDRVMDIPKTKIERPLSSLERIRADYIEGEALIHGNLLGVLRLDTIVSPERNAVGA